MEQVQSGDTVRVHYTGTLKSGEMFDTSEGRDPLQFVAGQGQVIKGFDDAVLDMKVGDKKTVHIPVEHAYGPKNQDMLVQIPRAEFPADVTPEIGMELQMSDPEGHVFPVIVADIQEEFIMLDANHPLAGEDLTFDIAVTGLDKKPSSIIMP